MCPASMLALASSRAAASSRPAASSRASVSYRGITVACGMWPSSLWVDNMVASYRGLIVACAKLRWCWCVGTMDAARPADPRSPATRKRTATPLFWRRVCGRRRGVRTRGVRTRGVRPRGVRCPSAMTINNAMYPPRVHGLNRVWIALHACMPLYMRGTIFIPLKP
jgi:hypothetical protein